MEICITPRSIAEISSRLGLPLGVTRVLVADLAADAAVHVDTAEFATASVTDRVELLELLLAGVRAL